MPKNTITEVACLYAAMEDRSVDLDTLLAGMSYAELGTFLYHLSYLRMKVHIACEHQRDQLMQEKRNRLLQA